FRRPSVLLLTFFVERAQQCLGVLRLRDACAHQRITGLVGVDGLRVAREITALEILVVPHQQAARTPDLFHGITFQARPSRIATAIASAQTRNGHESTSGRGSSAIGVSLRRYSPNALRTALGRRRGGALWPGFAARQSGA